MKGVIVALALLFGTVAWAHDRASTRVVATPAEMAQRQTNHLTRFFSLTSDQRNKVLGILTNADTQAATMRDRIRPLRANLSAEIKGNQPDQINATLHQLAPLQEKVESARAVAAGEIYATVLNPQQRQQLTNGVGPLLWPGYRMRAFRQSGYQPNASNENTYQNAYLDDSIYGK